MRYGACKQIIQVYNMTNDSSNPQKSEVDWYNIAYYSACGAVALAYFIYKKNSRVASLGFFSSTFNRTNFGAHDNDLKNAKDNYYSLFRKQHSERDVMHSLLAEQTSQGLQITNNAKIFLLTHQAKAQPQEVDRSTNIETLYEELMQLITSYPILPQGVLCTIQDYNDTGEARAEHHAKVIECFTLYFTLLEEKLKEVEQIPLTNINI